MKIKGLSGFPRLANVLARWGRAPVSRSRVLPQPSRHRIAECFRKSGAEDILPTLSEWRLRTARSVWSASDLSALSFRRGTSSCS